jgi:predicted DNA-binding WGR domain protein
MKRRFQFTGGSSAKFYEIEQSEKSVTSRYGRLGTSGQTITKSFGSREQAARHAQDLVEQKLRKGYRETQVA